MTEARDAPLRRPLAPEDQGLRATSKCPVMKFQLPEGDFKTHPGGQAHLDTAKNSECPGLLFLAYHVGLDLDGRISRSAEARGVSVPERGDFYNDIHKLVQKVKEEHSNQHWVFVVWCLILTVALPAGFTWSTLYPNVYSALFTAFVFEIYFLNIFHARHHKGGHLYKHAKLDRLLGPFYDLIDRVWGYQIETWWHNHHVQHHMHTNGQDEDPDIPASYPLIRSGKEQPRIWFHRLQTFYWPFLLLFSVARFPVENISKHGGHWIFFMTWLMAMFIVPYIYHGLRGLACSAILFGVAGINLTYKFSVSHAHPSLHDENNSPFEVNPDPSKMEVDDWLGFQIRESISWGGYLSCLIYGGINMQIEHHIAPALDPTLYPFLAVELKQLCAKYNIPYVSEPTILHAMKTFHVYLWKFGNCP